MKSLHKANLQAALESWNPQELNAEPVNSSSEEQKEQALAIFQKEAGSNRVQKRSAAKSELHSEGAVKKFAAWQPGLLSGQTEEPGEDEWSFLEIADTPFDKSWKVQKPAPISEGMNQRERLVSESEVSKILERARLQAEEIMLAAQNEADDVLLQAETEIEEQKKAGYEQGQIEARAEIEGAVKAVCIMVAEVEAWKTEFISESEKILVEMLKDIARKMFGEGAKLDPQTLQANLNRIMENARGLGVLKIFLNPNDARHLDPSWGEQQMLSLGEQVKIVPSSNVLPGGCLIKGNIGTVDGRVETQLEAILKTFDELDTSAG
jgi:flagellar assembly protein FliH